MKLPLTKLGWRVATSVDARCLAKLGIAGIKGVFSIESFKSRLARDRTFPAFLFVSITNACNLSCQGCWVSPTEPACHMASADIDAVIAAAKVHDSSFFGLLGGEPLTHPEIMDIIQRHSDCYFQLFTNGTLLTDAVARQLRQAGNVTPLISIEGLAEVSDERRGGSDVYASSLNGLEACVRQRLFTGVAASICKSNFHELVTESFLDELIARGAHYMWYYIYRPVGPNPTPELSLDEDQILELRQFMVRMRKEKAIAIVDAYWDADGKALCPAATGISHHIGPFGDVEPCPPIQFAVENIKDGGCVSDLVRDSAFLHQFRTRMSANSRGCVLLEDPALLDSLVTDCNARDTSGRKSGLTELQSMCARCGHHLPGQEVPETHAAYRIAKKNWFFGFGAYG